MTDNELQDALELFAHKLKNPLHAIGINLEVAKTKVKKKLPEEKELLKHLEIVAAESERLTELTLKFIKFTKLSDQQRSKVDLRKLLEGK